MNIEIINIGDELLIGQVVNTNSSYMSEVLNNAGINVKYITVIGDNPKEIENSVILALQRCDGVLITGGLGPTKDDMTKYCLNKMFGGTLAENKEVSNHVKNFFAKRNLPYTDTNRSQAMLPDNCKVIFNPVGTASGMVFNSNGKLVISMPGVPFEMQRMMQPVVQILTEHYKPETIIHRSILVSGIGESFLSDKLAPFEEFLQQTNQSNPERNFSLAYLPAAGTVKLRLSVRGGERENTLQEFENIYSHLQEEIQSYIVGEEDKNLAWITGEKLKKLSKTLAVAESCTGGNIAHQITLNPGASSYFKGGVTAYCNEIKQKVLNVKAKTLEDFSAVSEQTAKEMAQGVMNLYNTDYAIATTGLAGPDSDGTNTEIGTVYIALAAKGRPTAVAENCFKTSRENFIDRVTNAALFMLWENIK